MLAHLKIFPWKWWWSWGEAGLKFSEMGDLPKMGIAFEMVQGLNSSKNMLKYINCLKINIQM